MDHFITGKITTIDKNEDGYGIVLKTARDSIVLSVAYEEDFIDNMAQLQHLEVGQEISIKGFLFCNENWRREDRCIAVIVKQIKE